jgi:DNA-binding NtrC family response regulator
MEESVPFVFVRDSSTRALFVAIEGLNLSTQPSEQTVFVVDDEAVIAQTVVIILRNAGYEARSFCEPEAALDAVTAELPDLLVTDMAMPEMNGIELATRIQELRPCCKVLVFSGQISTLALVAKAENAGHHFDFLSKPAHPLKLLEKIDRVLDECLGGVS